MASLLRLSAFSLLGSAYLFHGSAATVLSPVPNPECNRASPTNLIPSSNITLEYGLSGASLVNVSLALNRPAILLEDVNAISSVDCEANSVTVVFNDTQAFNSAVSQWPKSSEFILVTNHLGDCDAELERGFFLAQGVENIQESLTVVITAEKTDVNATASSAEIWFSSVPLANTKRDLTWDPTLLNISNNLALPSSTTLFSYDPYVTITADYGDISSSVVLSGYLKYSVSKLELEDLYFDFDTSVSADLGLTVDVEAPYNTTATYTAPALSYSIVDIPGIITLGPALEFSIGVDLAASAAVSVTANFETEIDDGNVHVDFRNSSESSATGWTPKFTASANITEKADISVNPYIDVTVELACKLLGDLLDLSIGVTAEPKFNNDFILEATQEVSSTGDVSQPTSTDCEQGLEIKSEFEFSVIAFVTQYWQDTLYSVVVPIADECYSWL